MDWNDLRYLLAVHQTGSLAGAAKSLKVKTPRVRVVTDFVADLFRRNRARIEG